MNKDINICIVGIGNCACSLLQGIEYYKNIKDNSKHISGLMHPVIGDYKISDIKVVASFDIDSRKIGSDLSDALFYPPNNTKFFSDVPFQDVEIMKGPVLDGISDHMKECFFVDNNQKELTKDDILNILKETDTQIIINYVPVGSQELTEFWSNIALESKCAFVNAIPAFISSNNKWAEKFRMANLPIIGDDIKSSIGATELHRTLVQMIIDRGGKINNTRQLNYGGNTDFLNMLDRNRLKSKKISKTEAVQSVLGEQRLSEENIHIGPSDFIPNLKDNKICDINIEFEIFGDIPCSINLKLSVEDSPNSAGIVVDAIRCAKLALDRKMGGPILPACAYFCKHPPIQMEDHIARQQLEDFIKGDN